MLNNIIFEIFIIFFGSAFFGSFLLLIKQPLILGYIFFGMLSGPLGMKIISNVVHLESISHFGIILLMFLLGLNLEPKKFLKIINETALITVLSSIFFTGLFFIIAILFKFSVFESLIIGIALLFSSTIIGIKLIPTSTLHHKHIGEVMISILLFQDILAIFTLLFLYGDMKNNVILGTGILLLKGVLLVIGAYFVVKYIILKVMRKFDRTHEYLFLVSLAWCLLLAEIAHLLGLSYEIGAFIAGIMLAISPISLYMAEKLKPLREFFLIIFFYSIGAELNLMKSKAIFIPSIILAMIIIFIKPLVYKRLFLIKKESESFSTEMGIRLGQASEFALLISYGAFSNKIIGENTFYLIQLTTILTFVFSTYITSKKYRVN
ncbi:MAG: hypothetical protein B6I28_04045 [Fusobacteriia bacterium 4572_132]|nr:MAG: hypothetical protein B6I28_04045 [Fusobacteriia bacterium 4572_132]